MMTDTQRIDAGRPIRREILGLADVDKPGVEQTRTQREFQRFTLENCCSTVWARSGLEGKTRSMLNLGMLAELAREVHVRGALKIGVSEDEIVESILQCGVYAGVPIASEAIRIADHVLDEIGRATERQ